MADYHQPICRILDPSDGQRIPDLIPEELRPRLTEMIWKAVVRQDWRVEPGTMYLTAPDPFTDGQILSAGKIQTNT